MGVVPGKIKILDFNRRKFWPVKSTRFLANVAFHFIVVDRDLYGIGQ